MPTDPIVLHLAPSGAAVAERLAAALGCPYACLASGAVAEDLRALFLGGRPIVAVMSAGIVVRALAPVLTSKHTEPAVLAVSEDGASVVPLLGGHRGANALAARAAAATGGHAAVTTAGDTRLGVALDAPPDPWRLENPEDAKAAMAALLAGAPATLSGAAPWLASLPVDRRSGPASPAVLAVEGAAALVYRRRDLVLGVGCARGCAPDHLIGLARRTLAEAGLSAFAVAGVFSLDLKADEPAVHALAADLGVPARFFAASALEAVADRLPNPSETVFREVGCHGVAEGAALVGSGGDLAVEKCKSATATVAVATIPDPETWTPPGGRRGRLSVVGLGPGHADWRTPEASRRIAEADLLVGYGLYLDLLGPLAAGKPRHDFPLGGEEARCRFALERAGEGRDVALVCSGDAGIYAMAALVMEVLARGDLPAAAARAEVVVVPGVSAFQAAAARSGALIGHDFCAVSLSDLLTPRDDILKRLRAAAEGDFVVALYNPVSRRRRTLLGEARGIFLEHRAPGTPVVIARNLGRADEAVHHTTLEALRTADVDMLSVVLVGASASRAFERGDGACAYTPRGYAAKQPAPAPTPDAIPEEAP